MSQEETLQALTGRLDRIEQLTLIGAKATLDITEAALYTGMSTGHLYRLTSQRGIPYYKKNRKVYFNKSELDAWMQETRIPTMAEIDRQATTYCATH